MSGVNAAQGAQGSSTPQKTSNTKTQKAQKQKAPNSVVNNGKTKRLQFQKNLSEKRLR